MNLYIYYSIVVYTITVFARISLSYQNWSKIKKPVSQSFLWPEGRSAYAASHITDTVVVMIGGRIGGDSVLSMNDVWLLLCDTNQWKKVLFLSYTD